VGNVDILDITEAGADTVVWNEGGVDVDFRWEGVGALNALFIQGSDGKIGIGCADIPHGGGGAAMLALEGADNSVNGPFIQITTAADNYPLVQMLNLLHDNIFWNLDSYWAGPGTWLSSDADSNFQLAKYSDSFRIRYDSGIAQGAAISWNIGIVLDTLGKVFLNDTANAFALGPSLTIDGAGHNDEYITLQDSTNVAHGMTAITETPTYGALSKAETTSGGLIVRGLKDADGLAGYTLDLQGFLGEAVDTTKSIAGIGCIHLRGAVKSGTTVTALGADGNIVVIRDNAETRFIFDKEGEIHSDDIIGVGNDWDEWDDLQLASDISRLPKAKFDEMVRYKGKDFERAGLLTLSVDEEGRQHAFIRHKANIQFTWCCFADIHDRFVTVNERLNIYERAFKIIGKVLGIPQRELLALAN